MIVQKFEPATNSLQPITGGNAIINESNHTNAIAYSVFLLEKIVLNLLAFLTARYRLILIITSVHIEALQKNVLRNPLKLHKNSPRIQPFAIAVIRSMGIPVKANAKSATARLNTK